MQLVRLLLLLHVGATAALLLLLSLVVLGQRVRSAVAGRARRGAPVVADAVPAQATPASGASVLDWTVDLRGVGQREAALRT